MNGIGNITLEVPRELHTSLERPIHNTNPRWLGITPTTMVQLPSAGDELQPIIETPLVRYLNNVWQCIRVDLRVEIGKL